MPTGAPIFSSGMHMHQTSSLNFSRKPTSSFAVGGSASISSNSFPPLSANVSVKERGASTEAFEHDVAKSSVISGSGLNLIPDIVSCSRLQVK
ncbi:unnamed protein product [Protopolystoma xenopodis]|uniref:Uncharacterized protein n=1 Tax=Protopolystoma xenopodis TaxID=117903 RepID=A0A3S5AID8_9PLAT|nr:unnamed protein product [Protopolystoma xenopodis]